MKIVRRSCLMAALLVSTHGVWAADSLREERISAAYVLVAGRLPNATERAALRGDSSVSISALIAQLDKELGGQRNELREIARRACLDAFGVEPSGNELSRATGRYTTQLTKHLAELSAHRDEYGKVVQRAYQHVIRRDPYPEEIAYWNQRDVVSYALLTAAIENWARRNQPGLMVTSGEATVSVNSEFLVSVRLAPVVADEVAAALGAPLTQDDSDRARAIARTVLSPGGGQLISNGGIAFVAVGR